MASHRLSEEDRARGRLARQAKRTAEQRALDAYEMNIARWYRPRGSHMERIETHLRITSQILRRAMEDGNDDKVMRAQVVMATFERMKIWLDRSTGIPTGPAIDIDQVAQEAATKYAIARKQREETTIDGTAEQTSANHKE